MSSALSSHDRVPFREEKSQSPVSIAPDMACYLGAILRKQADLLQGCLQNSRKAWLHTGSQKFIGTHMVTCARNPGNATACRPLRSFERVYAKQFQLLCLQTRVQVTVLFFRSV